MTNGAIFLPILMFVVSAQIRLIQLNVYLLRIPSGPVIMLVIRYVNKNTSCPPGVYNLGIKRKNQPSALWRLFWTHLCASQIKQYDAQVLGLLNPKIHVNRLRPRPLSQLPTFKCRWNLPNGVVTSLLTTGPPFRKLPSSWVVVLGCFTCSHLATRWGRFSLLTKQEDSVVTCWRSPYARSVMTQHPHTGWNRVLRTAWPMRWSESSPVGQLSK